MAAPRESSTPRFAVLGAGHGGLAMAAYLGTRGLPVRLWNRSAPRIEPVAARGGIELNGIMRGFGPVELATTDMEAVLGGSDAVMVVVPASGHGEVARRCAPFLRDDHVVVLHPGRTGGALEFRAELRRAGYRGRAVVAETQTFVFASRSAGPAMSRIFRIKNAVPVAAMPAGRTAGVVRILGAAFPQFVAAESVLKTSLDNVGAIFHPAPTLLNAGRIESTHGDFDYYHDGITPSVARVMEAMDAERLAVAEALGVRAMSAREWLEIAYGARGNTLHEAVLDNAGYAGIKAPASMENRYIFEDVPASLVPMASLGDLLGVATPVIKSIIQLASIVHGEDYWSGGRTAERLGLQGLDAPAIRRLAAEGEEAHGGAEPDRAFAG